MPDYRLYLLNPYSGHIDGVEELSSADDVGAIALATERDRGVPAELWCRGRKVCRIDAPPEVSKYGLRKELQRAPVESVAGVVERAS
jgi:hypothetical protein